MNEIFGYRYNPSYTPQPHFMPGYGGYLPGAFTRFGVTYGSVSHEVSKKQPIVAARLAHLEPYYNDSSKKGRVTLECACKKNEECQNERIPTAVQGKINPIPEYVCPGYMGCLTMEKKGVPLNSCCDGVLRELMGCHQDPHGTSEERREDPFPGPPPQPDFMQERKRCRNGVWI